MKKIWALVLAAAMLVTVLCLGVIPASAAVTGTFVDTIVPEFAIPEIVDYSAVGDDLMNTHRMACEANPDLGATLLIKQAEPRDPGHTEYITYKMAKNIAGFEFQTMCCAGLGNPLEDITVFISKTGAEGTWATVKTQATRYTYDPNIYAGFDKAYWHQSTLMNAQKIPTGYKYLKIQFNPCTDEGDVPWNIAIDTVTITMGSNVAAPVIPEDQTFLTYEQLKDMSTTDPTTPTEPTTPSAPSTEPSEPTTPSTQPTEPERPKIPTIKTDRLEGVKAGETVTVPVRVIDNPGIVGLHLNVLYDANVLTLVDAQGQDFAGVEFGPLDNAGNLSMIWLDAINENNTADGVLANLTFTVAEDAAPGSYTVEPICYDSNEIFNAAMQPVEFVFSLGSVVVVEELSYIPGDVDGNGTVNVRDLGRLQQYLNGFDVTINEQAANVTGDSSINVRDYGLLQQYLNGWDVTLQGGGSTPSEPSEPSNPTEPSIPPTEPSTPPTQPEEPEVDMPGAGYDLDGKNRIIVSGSELKDNKASFTFKNVSKENGKEWIIPEYSRVNYVCYDANGNQLSSGAMTLGALEGGDTITCTITLPAGAVRVAFTGNNLEYWTPWS